MRRGALGARVWDVSCICCMCVFCVHPVNVLNAAFCIIFSLIMRFDDERGKSAV